MSHGWTNMISSTTIKNPRTKGREKFITKCCCVGRNDRNLIRDIVTGFRLVEELIMFNIAQE